jgi:dihydropteroate synthase
MVTNAKDTFFYPKLSLQCRGKIINLSQPKVMGILNITPDSFYDGGKYLEMKSILLYAGKMLDEGADMIDIGAASSRPGADLVTKETEQHRLLPVLKALVKEYPDTIWSIDTYNAETAEKSFDEGAHIINDISAGSIDDAMFATVARLKVPYIMMHMKGRPSTMQENPSYTDLMKEVVGYFSERISKLKKLDVNDIIIDPGFGFGKTVQHNFKLLKNLDFLKLFELPILVGLSRKSIINKTLNTTPEDALNGTTVLHTLALQNGANILRVHDVKAAKEVVRLFTEYNNHNSY